MHLHPSSNKLSYGGWFLVGGGYGNEFNCKYQVVIAMATGIPSLGIEYAKLDTVHIVTMVEMVVISMTLAHTCVGCLNMPSLRSLNHNQRESMETN